MTARLRIAWPWRLMGVVETPIDVVVSGINPNANIGHDVTYSGTVTAAMEAAIGGVPGVAVSLDAPEFFSGPLDYSTAAIVAQGGHLNHVDSILSRRTCC